jgi:hypothetical protein
VRTRRVSPLARSRPRTRSSRGKRVGTGDFADAADGQADRCAGDCGGDVIGRHRLDRCGRDPHGVVVGCRVRDALDELVELRRVNDREGDAGFLDQLFLYLLGAEVPTGEQSVGADHGECDVVVHAGLLRRGEQVARGGGEEVPCGSSSNDGEFETSTTTRAPASTSSRRLRSAHRAGPHRRRCSPRLREPRRQRHDRVRSTSAPALTHQAGSSDYDDSRDEPSLFVLKGFFDSSLTAKRMDHREFIPYVVWQRTANASRSLWSRTVLNEAGLTTTVVGSGKRPTQTMARRVRYGFV